MKKEQQKQDHHLLGIIRSGSVSEQSLGEGPLVKTEKEKTIDTFLTGTHPQLIPRVKGLAERVLKEGGEHTMREERGEGDILFE